MAELTEKQIEKIKKIQKSRAERITQIFTKSRGILKSQRKKAKFKEPIAQLRKLGGEVEFYENVTKGRFEFTHTNGEERYILINPKYILTFPYGAEEFRGYWLDEDHPLPLPEQPTITGESFELVVDKTLNDIKEWKAKQIQATGDLIWKIALGAIGIIIAYALYRMLAPTAAPSVPEETIIRVVNETAQTVARNATIL